MGWQDCNDYDEIAPEDLDDHLNAYEPFLSGDYEDDPDSLLQYGPDSSDMGLDAPMYFADTLANAEWSFVHQQDLTVRKMYHLHRWNVVYDLGDGSGYFSDSTMKGYCAGKLNSRWFMIDEHGHEGHSPEGNAMIAQHATDVAHRPGNSISGSMMLMLSTIILLALLKLCWSRLQRKDGSIYSNI